MKNFCLILCLGLTAIFINISSALALEPPAPPSDSLPTATSSDSLPSATPSDSSPTVPSEIPIPPIFIKAVNPGYTIDGKANVGELIELSRLPSDSPLSLAGLVLSCTNSSGTRTELFEFPENSWMTGESILLRLAGSSEPADLEYKKTLAMKAGPLVLSRGDKILDSVCWTGKDDCLKEFKSTAPTTLVRDLEISTFSHQDTYTPHFSIDTPGYFEEKIPEETPVSQCRGLEFSEILSFYESSQSEQFIELYNPTADQILLDGCQIGYKNKYYPLSGLLQPESYFLRLLPDFNLTKNPNSTNTLELIDTDSTVVDTLVYANGQQKSTSYAKIGYDASGGELWRITFAPTPGAPNIFQEFKTCTEGKVLNLETGNCVKPTTVTETVCPAGKILNPATGRCRTIEPESSAPKTCAEGYFLNPATGRCKKFQRNTGADYALVPETYTDQTSFIALYVTLGVVAVGLIYVLFEFRVELKKFFDKFFRRAR